jgi:hypothetical protein
VHSSCSKVLLQSSWRYCIFHHARCTFLPLPSVPTFHFLTFGRSAVPRNRPIPFGRGTRLCREPTEARQLRPRDPLRAQIRHSSIDGLEVLDASLHLYWVRIPFTLPPVLLPNSCPHSVLIPVYAFSLFLPTIINDLGYEAAQAQLLSTPPYIAGCICTVIIGIISDKYKSRGPFVCLSTTVGIIGYSILYGTNIKGLTVPRYVFLSHPSVVYSPW